jgi:hypothetical protein
MGKSFAHGFISFMLTYFCLRIAALILALCIWIEGLIMCFHASVVIGIVGLFTQVPFGLEALVYWFTGYDIALHIAQALALP